MCLNLLVAMSLRLSGIAKGNVRCIQGSIIVDATSVLVLYVGAFAIPLFLCVGAPAIGATVVSNARCSLLRCSALRHSVCSFQNLRNGFPLAGSRRSLGVRSCVVSCLGNHLRCYLVL
jgi:hypothetical protein